MTEKEKPSMLKIVKPTTAPEKVTRTTLDTIEITPAIVNGWAVPPFQRPLRVNDKVRALAEVIRSDGGVIPGTLTLGVLDRKTFILDGQHRREAFLISTCETGYVDVRWHHFDSMGDMGEEFVNLNSQLVRMRPDDILRGLEGTIPALGRIRKKCAFVGYDQIRRGGAAPIVSMSALIRCWHASSTDIPRGGGTSAQALALQLTEDEADTLISFLDCAFQAWGRDEGYHRLWSGLNLTIAMWMFRRMVITPYNATTPKLTRESFRKCLMSVSADSNYVDWLVGRLLCERDRGPCYARMKAVFAKRIETETGTKPRLPQPPWASK